MDVVDEDEHSELRLIDAAAFHKPKAIAAPLSVRAPVFRKPRLPKQLQLQHDRFPYLLFEVAFLYFILLPYTHTPSSLDATPPTLTSSNGVSGTLLTRIWNDEDARKSCEPGGSRRALPRDRIRIARR